MNFLIDSSSKLDDKQRFALQNYLNKHGSIKEFKQDIKIPHKIELEISRILIDSDKANPRILLNKAITFFNIFNIIVAKEILFDLVDVRFHIQLNTLLVAIGMAQTQDYSIEELDMDFYKILKREIQ